MSVYFCFSFGSRTDHQSAKILVAPRLSRRGCSFRTRERWRLQNKRNAFIGRRARCSEDSSSSVSSASCSKPSGPRSGTWQNRKGRGVNSVIHTLHKDWDPVSWVEVRERHMDAHSCLQRPSIPSRQSTSKEFYIKSLHLTWWSKVYLCSLQDLTNANFQVEQFLSRGQFSSPKGVGGMRSFLLSFWQPKNHLSGIRQAELPWTLIIHVCNYRALKEKQVTASMLLVSHFLIPCCSLLSACEQHSSAATTKLPSRGRGQISTEYTATRCSLHLQASISFLQGMSHRTYCMRQKTNPT